MTETATEVWRGAEALRPFLIPVDELEPFPGNPRRGDIETVRASLRRFGQVRAILVDGKRIVAGHHVRLAAIEEGWTHVAAIANQFESEEDARAYLLADNRIPELGEYARDELLSMLEELESAGSWGGTGYSSDDLEDLRAELDRIAEMEQHDFHGGSSEDPEDLARREALRAASAIMREVVLVFDEAEYDRFGVLVRILRKEYGTTGVAETIFRAIESEAMRLNQGAESDSVRDSEPSPA